ncbi:MAG: hypothetical protein O7D33_09480, partial [Chloroflexi bacterium]|nr:hypothetical protein [Chloroflexota bacterium]
RRLVALFAIQKLTSGDPVCHSETDNVCRIEWRRVLMPGPSASIDLSVACQAARAEFKAVCGKRWVDGG